MVNVAGVHQPDAPPACGTSRRCFEALVTGKVARPRFEGGSVAANTVINTVMNLKTTARQASMARRGSGRNNSIA